MIESILASFLFWVSFTLSPGPFWTAVMESAKHTGWWRLTKNFVIYQFIGWAPQVVLITIIVSFVGAISLQLVAALHFFGGGVIFYLSYLILKTKIQKKKFDFHWKKMMVISWSSPKVWVTVPIGALSASYADEVLWNAILFYLFGAPLFYAGFYLWAFLGKQGGKIAKEKFSYFTTALLVFFGIYLIVEGFQLLGAIK
jgi:threonine/homoserine/homoserine lactone efflux protein